MALSPRPRGIWLGSREFAVIAAQIDPSLLEDFTLHFYGRGGRTELKRLGSICSGRGINASIHGLVDKEVILKHLTRAKGVIHWAMEDFNPRVAYGKGSPSSHITSCLCSDLRSLC